MPSKRGVIVGRTFWKQGEQLYASSLSSTFLRKHLLFWDEIDYPEGDCSEKTEDNPDLIYLVNEGIITRTKTAKGQQRTIIARPEEGTMDPDGKWTSKWPIHAWLSSYAMNDAYAMRSKAEPGKWSMSSMSELPRLNEAEESPGICFELYDTLPVPDKTVPLPDVLEFREARYDELLALRGHLDEIYLKIISSRDIPRARIAELDRLERSLQDLKRTMNESGMAISLSDLRSNIAGEFDLLFSSAVGGAGVAISLGMASATAGVAGAGTAVCAFICKKIMTPKVVDITHPFLYLESAKGNLV